MQLRFSKGEVLETTRELLVVIGRGKKLQKMPRGSKVIYVRHDPQGPVVALNERDAEDHNKCIYVKDTDVRITEEMEALSTD